MIDRHCNGSEAYCQPEDRVALGFVEGVNNKIRVIRWRSYGLRDEEYLRLKVLTYMLDPILPAREGEDPFLYLTIGMIAALV